MKKLIVLITLTLFNNSFAAPSIEDTIAWMNDALKESDTVTFDNYRTGGQVDFQTTLHPSKDDVCTVNIEIRENHTLSNGDDGLIVKFLTNVNFADLIDVKASTHTNYTHPHTQESINTVHLFVPHTPIQRGFRALESRIGLIKDHEGLYMDLFFEEQGLANRFVKAVEHLSRTCKNLEISQENDFRHFDDLEERAQRLGKKDLFLHQFESTYYWIANSTRHPKIGNQQFQIREEVSFKEPSRNRCTWTVNNISPNYANSFQKRKVNLKDVNLVRGTRTSLILKDKNTGRLIVLFNGISLETLRVQKYTLRMAIEACNNTLSDLF